MNDMIRWAAKDVDDCEAGIASCEEWAAHYEAEADRVAFDPVVQMQMLSFAAMKRQAADEGRQRLSELRRRLEYVGAEQSPRTPLSGALPWRGITAFLRFDASPGDRSGDTVASAAVQCG